MPDEFNNHITNDHIRELPLLTFDGDIHVIDEEAEMNEALDVLSREPNIGFDTEKKPTFHKGEYNPVAIIQMATLHEAFLFRMNKLDKHKPLFDFMETSATTKLGISIHDDLKDLNKIQKFHSTSFLDINTIAKDLGVEHMGVKKLAAIFLNHRISKSQQTSNWENDILTPGQQKYAATDAWICLRIHQELQHRGYID